MHEDEQESEGEEKPQPPQPLPPVEVWTPVDDFIRVNAHVGRDSEVAEKIARLSVQPPSGSSSSAGDLSRSMTSLMDVEYRRFFTRRFSTLPWTPSY